jgi:uncharacterized membrane-anchored protein
MARQSMIHSIIIAVFATVLSLGLCSPTCAAWALDLPGQASVTLPDGFTAAQGDAARDARTRAYQPPRSGEVLFATDGQSADPILVSLVWRPVGYAKVTEAPGDEAARAAINADILASPTYFGPSGIAAQMSDWIEPPTFDPKTHLLRDSYSVETRTRDGNGTAFTYRATVYGGAGRYEIRVHASADRAMQAPAVYETLVQSLHFKPGATYEEGEAESAPIFTFAAAEQSNLKTYIFLVALATVLCLLGALFWIIVWPTLNGDEEEA